MRFEFTNEHQLGLSLGRRVVLCAWFWADGEFYVDPEAAQGVPLSNLTGLEGFTNGEMARSSGPTPKIYRARAFLRQTWGDLSVLDIFDANAYNHDPRTQFLNWSVMTHDAFDYTGDARGYSWRITLERYLDDWLCVLGASNPMSPTSRTMDFSLATAPFATNLRRLSKVSTT